MKPKERHMNKEQFKADVKRLRDIFDIIRMKESKLDPGLMENARNERRAAIYKEFSEEMSEIKIRLAQGVEWLQGQRAILADPFYALTVAAMEQADDANHGHAIVAANVAWMPDDSAINMLAGAWHPAVLLALASNLKARMDGHEDPVRKRKMHDAILIACERFVKWDAVAEYASLELEPVRLQYEEGRKDSFIEKPLDAVAKLDLGRRMEALEKLSRAGTFPGKVRPTYQARI
jgi:hypothetical protein